MVVMGELKFAWGYVGAIEIIHAKEGLGFNREAVLFLTRGK